MNNRIQELFEECGITIDPLNVEATRKEIDFLCEQIVLECANICEDRPAFSGRTLSGLILEHFGMNDQASSCKRLKPAV